MRIVMIHEKAESPNARNSPRWILCLRYWSSLHMLQIIHITFKEFITNVTKKWHFLHLSGLKAYTHYLSFQLICEGFLVWLEILVYQCEYWRLEVYLFHYNVR